MVLIFKMFKDGTNVRKLSESEMKKVIKFQKRVESLECKRISSKYDSSKKSKNKIGIIKLEKTAFRQAYDTVSPLLSVLITVICSLFGANYFLKNIIHEFTGRIAIGLVVGSILAFIEIYFILKRFQAEWDSENIIKF